ncbi:S41 family peptidase [Mechercharimyces sp. CAU 1602]|uniref:S41 family peptidase n=1 Tax=Mechercharimyces sp. CAU 1602 TaxID=2973933 RepID=UPI00216364F7|nr:S41 family peptidase [Mechercharimyces sp. CAU 1602]MCS1352221.1 S41 family peptidase [Mechercharimyces sp. CAU 1602]
MYLRGRTVTLIVIVAVLFSSLTTVMLAGDGGILARVVGVATGQGSNIEMENQSKIEQAYSMIKSQYIGDVKDEALVDGAIEGMVGALDDPYSAYMDKEAAQQFHSSLDSSFEGIGAEVTMKNGLVTIVSPIKGSPAEKAGLRPEDQILKVNGESLEGLDLRGAVEKIRGPKGSKAKLAIMRPGQSELMTVTVVRDEIPIETIHSEMMSGKIGRIEITQFSQETATDFTKALDQLEKDGMKGLVIDVRGNPGGLLNVVEEIGNQLIPNEKTIVMKQDKEGNTQETKSTMKGKKEYPIAILIDKGSASASEILAAALKESGGYLVIGENSYGKGTVQTARDFSDGSNLKLTIAKWLTPNGKWIHKKGVKPDIEVKRPDYYQVVPPQPEKPLQRDTASTEVKNVQLILKTLGYRPDRVDGYYSDQTETAVKAFQKLQDLKVTGEVDEKTAAALQEAFIEHLKEPDNDVQLQTAIETLKKKAK